MRKGLPNYRTMCSDAMAMLIVAGCSQGSFVERVTISNETEYPATVEVGDGSGESWLALAIVAPGEEATVRSVIDQGEEWVFRFAYGGEHEENVTISRSELEGTDWSVEVPQSFEDALRSMGVELPL